MLLSIDRILDFFNDPSADQSHCDIVDVELQEPGDRSVDLS
jgi:hypothetical protein